ERLLADEGSAGLRAVKPELAPQLGLPVFAVLDHVKDIVGTLDQAILFTCSNIRLDFPNLFSENIESSIIRYRLDEERVRDVLRPHIDKPARLGDSGVLSSLQLFGLHTVYLFHVAAEDVTPLIVRIK